MPSQQDMENAIKDLWRAIDEAINKSEANLNIGNLEIAEMHNKNAKTLMDRLILMYPYNHPNFVNTRKLNNIIVAQRLIIESAKKGIILSDDEAIILAKKG